MVSVTLNSATHLQPQVESASVNGLLFQHSCKIAPNAHFDAGEFMDFDARSNLCDVAPVLS